MYGQGQQYPQGQPPQPEPPYGQPPQPGTYGAPQPPQQPYGQPPQQYGYPPQPQPAAAPYGAPQPPQQPYGQPQEPQYGAPPQYGVPPQFGQDPQYGQAPPYGQPPQYGAPQHQYGQQPPPYGQHQYGGPMPGEPRRSNTGLIIGLVIGAVVLVGGGGLIWALSSSDSPVAGGGAGSSTTGKFKLAAPATLPGGYTQKSTKSEAAGALGAGSITYDGGISASYLKGKDVTDTISVGGSWGTFNDPGTVIKAATDKFASGAGAGAAEKVTWKTPLAAVDAKDAKDPGGKLSCGVATLGTIDAPLCVWANHSTVGTVVFLKISLTGKAAAVTPAQAADQAREIRDAVVVAK
ncbi:hypothetical protein [Kitasatospora sp. NPDC002040]|uniref:hypothetical protein n=1 Tax=Kitasatospora sp. NPDC002040 TaxID=3154661 RepID=UPI003327D5F1